MVKLSVKNYSFVKFLELIILFELMYDLIDFP